MMFPFCLAGFLMFLVYWRSSVVTTPHTKLFLLSFGELGSALYRFCNSLSVALAATGPLGITRDFKDLLAAFMLLGVV